MLKKKPDYPMSSWAVRQITREDGKLEDICEHGCGHPNKAFLKDYPEYTGVHACDGCCSSSKITTKLIEQVRKGRYKI